jgi:hypothetical protein
MSSAIARGVFILRPFPHEVEDCAGPNARLSIDDVTSQAKSRRITAQSTEEPGNRGGLHERKRVDGSPVISLRHIGSYGGQVCFQEGQASPEKLRPLIVRDQPRVGGD